MSFNAAMNWRYACQKFQPGQQCEAQLTEALQIARLAPSSFGVQPWRMVLVENTTLRSKLLDVCYAQPSIVQAGHLVIFTILNSLNHHHLERHAKQTAEQRSWSLEEQDNFLHSLEKELLQRRSQEDLKNWMRAQCYLGLGVFLSACAELRIDSCPMEGFKPEKVDAILKLPEHGLASTAIVAVGLRAKDDETQKSPKVRRNIDEMIIRM